MTSAQSGVWSHASQCPGRSPWGSARTLNSTKRWGPILLSPLSGGREIRTPDPLHAIDSRRVQEGSAQIKTLQSLRFQFFSVCRGTREFKLTVEVIAEVYPLLFVQRVISAIMRQRPRHSTRQIDRPTEWKIPEISRAGPPQALWCGSCCFCAPLRWVCWKLSGYLSPKVSIRSIPICPNQIVPKASTSGWPCHQPTPTKSAGNGVACATLYRCAPNLVPSM